MHESSLKRTPIHLLILHTYSLCSCKKAIHDYLMRSTGETIKCPSQAKCLCNVPVKSKTKQAKSNLNNFLLSYSFQHQALKVLHFLLETKLKLKSVSCIKFIEIK